MKLWRFLQSIKWRKMKKIVVETLGILSKVVKGFKKLKKLENGGKLQTMKEQETK